MLAKSKSNVSETTDVTLDELIRTYGYWGAHPDFPVRQWQWEVDNGDTRQGYWEWVFAQLETPRG